MAVTILKQWRAKFDDQPDLILYSDQDLTDLPYIMKYCRSFEKSGDCGLGDDGVSTHDGVSYKRERGAAPAPGTVVKGMSLAEVDAVLRAHGKVRLPKKS